MKQSTSKSHSRSRRSRRGGGASATEPPKSVRLVAAAMILRPGNPAEEVLICQRKPDQPMALKWEFPGGKLEAGESAQQALRRELNEELGIEAEIGPLVARVRHNYRNGSAVDLQFFAVRTFTGQLENRIFNQMQWSNFAALPDFDFLAADLGLIRDLAEGKLQIPPSDPA